MINFIIIATNNKVDSLSNRFDVFLENFKQFSEQVDNTNNSNTILINEDIKKLIKDSIRRNLFVNQKYPSDLTIEKYCKDLLTKTYPQNQNCRDKRLWDNIWFSLRPSVSNENK